MESRVWDRVNEIIEIGTLLVKYGVDLSASGLRGAPCPICSYADKNRPSLQIFPGENACFCHHCKTRLDIYALVKEKEHMDNRWEALKLLARQVGVADMLGPSEYEEMSRREKRSEALEIFAKHLNGTMGPSAKEYLLGRGIEEGLIASQLIGFIPKGAMFSHSDVHVENQLKELGLLLEGGRVSPAWQDRIFIPFWKNGHIFYWAGRAIDPNCSLPQMLPSNDKLRIQSKPVVGTSRGKRVLVVEGVFDFLSARQNEESVLGILGQSPVFDLPDHVEQVSLCFDWDASGEEYRIKFGLHFLKQRKEVMIISRPENLPENKKDLNDYFCAGGKLDQLQPVPLMDYLIQKLASDKKSNLPVVFKAISNLGPMAKEEAFRKIAVLTRHKEKTIKDEYDYNFRAEGEQAASSSDGAEQQSGHYDSGGIKYRIPIGYSIEPEGIFLYHGKYKELITSQTIIINGIGNDNLEGRLHVLLQFGKFEEFKSMIYRKFQIASSGELLKLADDGLDVHSGNSYKLVRYLAEFYNENEDLFPRLQIVSQLGWSGDLFNLPNYSISRKGTERVYYFENEIRRAGYLKMGSFEEWLSVVRSLKSLKDPSLMFFFLYAGFAGAILEKLSRKTSILHNFGNTSIGKTTAMMLAASIYGKPNTDGLMQRWYATKNFIGRALEQLRNVPLFLDELSVIRNADVQDLAYVVESQKAKGKASSINPLRTVPQRNWCTLIFSTGEPSILSDHSLGGAAVRVIEFSGNPFKEENRAFVEAFKTGLSENYGHAIEPFLRAFFGFDWRSVGFFWDEEPLSRIENRMADIFQAVYIAGVLAEQVFEFGVDPKTIVKNVFREVKKERVKEGDFVSRFVLYMLDFFAANRASFKDTIRGTIKKNDEYEYRSSELASKSKILGYVFKERFDAESFDLGIIKSEFNSIVNAWGAGATSRTLLMELHRKNIIICEKNDNRIRKRIDGEVKALIFFPNFDRLGE